MTIETIITTYRRPLLLKRAINSILKQTYSDFRICVYDNASDDQTEEIVRSLAEKDSRIKYHRHDANIGMMLNYQFAFEKIDSPYFSFLSDDDFLLPCFYETALKGLLQFPDVAFSACGIAQLDENGNFVGDPLSLWKSEGYFLPHEGLVEMVRARWRFPIPTGILFHRKVVEKIKPNFSDEMDFFWDPEYLMRIVAKFPVVTTKKYCGVYLAHGQCYSGSFYSKLLNDISAGEKYLKATWQVNRGIDKSSTLDTAHACIAKKLFDNCVEEDVMSFIPTFIVNRKFGVAHFMLKRYYSYYGFSFKLGFYHLAVIALKLCSALPFLPKLPASRLLKFLLFFVKCFYVVKAKCKCLLKRVLKGKASSCINPSNGEALKEYHKYGKKLFEDVF